MVQFLRDQDAVGLVGVDQCVFLFYENTLRSKVDGFRMTARNFMDIFDPIKCSLFNSNAM